MSKSVNRREREYLTTDEVEKLLSTSKQASRNPIRDYAILLLMYRHGLRVSELCSMKLSDINLTTSELYVNRLKGSDCGTHPLHNGEGGSIRAWLKEREAMNVPEGCDTLFVSERRRPLSRFTLNVMIEKFAQAAGLAHLSIHPHSLRHSCGYSLINRCGDVRLVQSYLGHKSLASTQRYTQIDSRRFVKLF
jgi:type 1 fimbriae regulatory protein FimB